MPKITKENGTEEINLCSGCYETQRELHENDSSFDFYPVNFGSLDYFEGCYSCAVCCKTLSERDE